MKGISYGISHTASRTIHTTSRQKDIKARSAVYLLIATILLTLTALASAQPTSAPSTTIPALFLSDIHFNPFADPAKVAKLNAAPAAEWQAILASPPSPTQPEDFAALSQACPVRGVDTDYTLLQSSLESIHTNASHTNFVTISGDLLAHSFDCKYSHLLPKATPSEYVSFTQKTIQYILSSLRTSLPGVPIYTALGNNDSGCTDYHLDATHDPFLAAVAPIVADALTPLLPRAERQAIAEDLASTGNYNAPLAAVPHTRLLVLDDLFLSRDYATCAAKPDPAPAAAQLAWLATQLAAARQHHDHVWVMAHIPPGVKLSVKSLLRGKSCANSNTETFLTSDSLAEMLTRNSDIIRLALFGHTHMDEIHLLTPEPTNPLPLTTDHVPLTTAPTGVPLKIVASISPVNGNHPTFTLARIDPATATLVDYTVIESSSLTGADTGTATTWTPSYTYSSTYHQPAFDAASLSALITGFQSDPSAKLPATQSYLRNLFPGDISPILRLVWPLYSCSLNHTSAAAYAACACNPTPPPPSP